METITKLVYVSIRGAQHDTPMGALNGDFEFYTDKIIDECCDENSYLRERRMMLVHFLHAAAAHPARFARRMRRLYKIQQALMEYERAEAKQPDAIPC